LEAIKTAGGSLVVDLDISDYITDIDDVADLAKT